MKNSTVNIIVDESKCARCCLCQLICSLSLTGVFNPDEAEISIIWNHEGDCKINFKEGCIDCGLCADYCVYGALSLADG